MKKFKYLSIYSGLPKEMYILFIARIITCMGSFILPLWTLILTQKIGLSKPQTGLMTTLFIVTQAPCLLFGGKLIDFIGRKKMILLSQTVGAIIYICCAFMSINRLTAIFIMIAADFYTVASPALDAVIADITKPENRKNSFSLIYLGINVGYTISPLLGGFLFHDHLFVLFILDAVTTLIAAFLIAVYIKEPEYKKLDTEGHDLNNLQEKTPVIKVLWKNRILLYFIITMFIFQFCYSQWGFALPLQLSDLFRQNGARNYSFLVSLNSFEVIVLTPLATILTRRMRSLQITAIGGFCYFLAFALFSLITQMPFFFIATFVMTLGEIIITVNTNTFIADHSPSTHRGRINSISSIIMGSSYAIAPSIMGNVIVETGYFTSWMGIAAFMLLGVACMALLDRKDKKSIEKV